MTRKKVMKSTKLLHLLVLVASVVFLFMHHIPASGQSEMKVYISDLDCSDFPTISFTLRALDSQGNVITGDLNTTGFTLFDNDTPVTSIRILEAETGPKNVVFSIDRGKYANLDNFTKEVRDVMNDFANQHFTESKDKVSIITHTSSNAYEVVLKETQSKSEFLQAISSLDLSSAGGEELRGLIGLEKIYDNLVQASTTGRVNTVIVHFSRFIEGLTYNSTIAEAKSLGASMAAAYIKVYVFQTDTSGDPNYDDAYQNLTTLSAGGYVFVPDKAGFQSGYTSILKKIDQDSKVFKAQFTSQLYVSDHTISLAKPGASSSSAIDKQKCQPIGIENPEIVFDSPKGGTGAEWQLKPGDTTMTIKAHVNWVDERPRDITKAELLANWEVVDTRQETISSDDPILLKLPVQTLLGSQSRIRVDLMIRVEDAWGFKGEDSISLDLIAPPTPTSTPPPISTEVKKGGGAPAPTPIISLPISPVATCQGKFTLACGKSWVTSNWLFLIAVGVVILLFLLLLSTRRQIAMISSPAREAIGKRVSQVREQVRKTLLGGASHRQEAIAYLQVLMARSDRTGIKIDIYNNRTTLGRDPSITDVQLYNPDDKTSVSGLHCTIFYDSGQGKFLITDDNSTNGTYVNGTRLVPNEPADLNDGDEIILGDVYRQGAKMRFEIATPHQELPPEVEPPPIEEDFNVDLEPSADGFSEAIPESPPKAKETPKKDFDETVPGYREEDATPDADNSGQAPLPPPGSSQKKGKDKSWLDKLG
jgi:hypothetical protein